MILVQLAGLTVWVQGSEVNLEGIEEAKETKEARRRAFDRRINGKGWCD